jgi:16S rRNA (guanine(966)-N(2))-methyltransferase RsmD
MAPRHTVLPTTSRMHPAKACLHRRCPAGTGSVGLEGLSRGAAECHFVEFDPWVTRTVLGKNITTCGFNKKSVVHTMRAEDFLAKAVQYPKYAGGAFDFVSLCPPYMLVSYPELFDLFDRSQLLHERSIMFVEYPKQLRNQVPETLGPLEMVRDRKYGRTCVAVYAAPPSE